jgi:hypothetical protein
MRTSTVRRTVLAALAVSVTAPSAAHAQASPSATEILSRAAKVVDPKALLATHRSVHVTQDVEIVGAGITGHAENYSARPDLIVSHTTLGPIGTISAGFDGVVGWLTNPATGPTLMDSGQVARLRHFSAFDAMLLRPEMFTSMSQPTVEPFEGRPAYKVHLVASTAFEYDAYFDVESGLRRGVKYDEKGQMGMMPVTLLYDEYRDFGGLLIPAKVTQRTATLALVQRTTKVEYDVVADSVFALPAAIKGLTGK